MRNTNRAITMPLKAITVPTHFSLDFLTYRPQLVCREDMLSVCIEQTCSGVRFDFLDAMATHNILRRFRAVSGRNRGLGIGLRLRGRCLSLWGFGRLDQIR